MKKLTMKQLTSCFMAPEQLPSLSLGKWSDLIFVLRDCRLLASLAELLIEKQLIDTVPEKARFHLLSALKYANRQAEQVRMESQAITSLLRENSVDCVYLKGASYVLNNWHCGAGRVSSDIDVLVRESELATAETLMLKNLWRHQEINDYDDKYYREYAHEIPPLFHIQRGTVLDVHHNLFLPVSGRAPNIESFWKYVANTAQGHQVFLPHAAFVHSVIHLFLNEEVVYGCRDMIDLWRLLEEHGDDRFIDGVVELCQVNGFNDELMLVSRLLRHWFTSSRTELLLCRVNAEVLPNIASSESKINVWFRIYRRALVPNHPFIAGRKENIARQLVFMRGHGLKMPLGVLIKHLAIKLHKGLLEWVTGSQDETPKQAELGEGFLQQINNKSKITK